MMKLYENIKSLRLANGMSQEELAKRAGYTDRSSIAKIEKGEVDLSQSKILAFADIFNVTPSQLMDDVVIEKKIKFDDYFPLLYCSNLSAGSFDELLDAEPDSVVYVPIKFQNRRKRLHAFKVNGESMNNVFKSGSIVIAEDADSLTGIKDGSIVVAFYNGEATVKRLFTTEDTVLLAPDSSDRRFTPIIIPREDNLRIIGTVIWHMNPEDISKFY